MHWAGPDTPAFLGNVVRSLRGACAPPRHSGSAPAYLSAPERPPLERKRGGGRSCIGKVSASRCRFTPGRLQVSCFRKLSFQGQRDLLTRLLQVSALAAIMAATIISLQECRCRLVGLHVYPRCTCPPASTVILSLFGPVARHTSATDTYRPVTWKHISASYHLRTLQCTFHYR